MQKNTDNVWSNVKTHLIYILIICLLMCTLGMSINRCTDTSGEYKHNIEALKDTIKYYQDKNGNLVATKLAFESDIKTLKLLNEDLYNQIDSLKLRPNNVAQIIHVGGEIENPKKDSTYIIDTDTISKGFSKDFNFNDNYRILEGNVDYKNDSLGIHINKDIVYFDYTVALDKNARMYIKSTNPYIKYNEFTGFTVPQQKHKKWSVGPAVNLGYDIINRNPSLSIGISLSYSLITW